MPTILTPTPSTTLPFPGRSHVRIKQAWDDPWLYVPWLTCTQCTEMAAPQIGSADFTYVFGRIVREHETAFSVSPPTSLTDYYVQVLLEKTGLAPQVVWTGVIADESTELQGNVVLTGVQQIKAYSMGHLLDRVDIDSSWCKRSTGDPFEVQRVLAFNERSKRGPTVLGNRSTAPDGDNDQLYYFSADNEVWTNRNIVEYLLAKYAPEGITWELDGQVELLDELESIWSFGGSVWEAITRLIDYRRGVGFYVKVQPGADAVDGSLSESSGDGGTVKLVVFSISDVDIKHGDKTLAKNPNQTAFSFPTADPYDKMVEPIPFRKTSLTAYDVIEIRASAPLKVCSDFSFPRGGVDGCLEAGWDTTELEANYLTPGSVSDFEANDKARSKDRFAGVYTRYRVPKEWKGYRLHNDQELPMIPKCLEDGDIDITQLGEFFNRNKRFLNYLPLEVGKDYSTSPVTDETDGDTEPEYRPMAVMYFPGAFGAANISFIDRMHEDDPDKKNLHFRTLDRELGIEITVSPRHYMALNHWEGAQVSDTDPVLDYEKITILGFFETDEWPRIVLRLNEATEDTPEKRLVITVPGCEVWHCNATIIDLDATGTIKTLHFDNRYPRDDRPKLEAVAAFAKAWYGVARQAVTITLKTCAYAVELGTVITEISHVLTREPVRTVVTGRSINFDAVKPTTTIETGYDTLDVVGLAGAGDLLF